MNPTEHDTRLAAALENQARIQVRLAYAQRTIAEGISYRVEAAKVEAAELAAELAPVTDEVDALNATYTGWSRFFLVRNHGGHIHSSMSCSTCFHDTQFGWLPTVSGKTEADAVAEFGPALCTICFPTAPSEWTGGQLREVTEAKAERAAVKAERDAKKAAKALRADGQPVRVQRDRIATIAAAKSYLTDATEWANIYAAQGRTDGPHPSFPEADVATIAAALADRTGETVADVLAAAAKRAAKR